MCLYRLKLFLLMILFGYVYTQNCTKNTDCPSGECDEFEPNKTRCRPCTSAGGQCDQEDVSGRFDPCCVELTCLYDPSKLDKRCLNPTSCINNGSACIDTVQGGSLPCCTGLKCTDQTCKTCLQEKTSCDIIPGEGFLCCDELQCIPSSPETNSGFCQKPCLGAGTSCNTHSNPCCPGLKCIIDSSGSSGTCKPCKGKGGTCRFLLSSYPCCDELECTRDIPIIKSSCKTSN